MSIISNYDLNDNPAYLHVIHHQLITELRPVLSICHLLIHQAVQNSKATVGARMNDIVDHDYHGDEDLPEGHGQVLVKLGEVCPCLLVTQLSNTNNLIVIRNWEAENIPACQKLNF